MKIFQFTLLVLISMIAFQARKTKEKITDKNSTILNKIKVKQSSNTIPHASSNDTILPFDSTVLYFTHQDIVAIEKQLSPKILQNIGIKEGNYYYKDRLQVQLRGQVGESTAKNYLSILESNSLETHEATIIKEKTDNVLSALATGQTVPNKLGGFHTIKENKNIPVKVKSIYKNFSLFTVVLPKGGYSRRREYIGSIHKGDICSAVSLFNIAYNETKLEQPLTMKERLIIIFQMEVGFESNISITNVSEIQNKEEIIRLITHNISAKINNIDRQFIIGFDYDKFYSIREITNIKEGKIFTIRFI